MSQRGEFVVIGDFGATHLAPHNEFENFSRGSDGIGNQSRPERRWSNTTRNNTTQRKGDCSACGKHEAIVNIGGTAEHRLETNLSVSTSASQVGTSRSGASCTALDDSDSCNPHVDYVILEAAADFSENVWASCILSAFGSGNIESVRKIMGGPLDVENRVLTVQDVDGYTSLHRSVVSGNSEIVNILGPYAAKSFSFLHKRTKNGWTALHLAVCTGSSKIVKILTSWYDRHGNEVEHPVNDWWDFSDDFWMTPLHYAVLKNSESIVITLLSSKAYSIHVNASDYHRRTAFHMACYVQESSSLVGPFLDNEGVDLNAVDCCASTPLHWAVYGGNPATVRAFTSRINTKGLAVRTTEEDVFGESVLEYATERFCASDVDRKKGRDVQKLLLTVPEVKDEVERHYRDRQVYIDAANAMLVCATLMASLTYPNKPDSTSSTNMLDTWSFVSSMVTIMAGGATVLPMSNIYIGKTVRIIRRWLFLTSSFLLFSLSTILLAQPRYLRMSIVAVGVPLCCLAFTFIMRIRGIRVKGTAPLTKNRGYLWKISIDLPISRLTLADFEQDLRMSAVKVMGSAPELKKGAEKLKFSREIYSEFAPSPGRAEKQEDDLLHRTVANISVSLESFFGRNAPRMKGVATTTAKNCPRCKYIYEAYNSVRNGLMEEEANLSMAVLRELSNAGMHYWNAKHCFSHECFSHRDCRENVVQKDEDALRYVCDALDKKRDNLQREELN